MSVIISCCNTVELQCSEQCSHEQPLETFTAQKVLPNNEPILSETGDNGTCVYKHRVYGSYVILLNTVTANTIIL